MKYSLLTSALTVVASTAAVAQIPERPNILWVMAEDMSQDLECYGMEAVKTPNLNALAEQGVLYNAACCTNPISSPSRSAMMTGLNQLVTNSHNHRSNRDVAIDTLYKPFTYYLRKAGYTCILGNHSVMGYGRKIDCNFKTEELGEWNGVDSFGLFDKLDEFTAADQPFFAQIQLVVTHRGDWWSEVTAASQHRVNPDDVVLPPYLADHPKIRTEWASYLDQIEYMDNEVGMLLEELKTKGVLDNTIIFFIGDNGRCEVKGKGYLYEPGVKIPMIAWGRGIKPTQVDEIVTTLDITASILDLAGVELPEYYEGKPLFEKRSGKSSCGSTYAYSARDTWDEVVECSRAITTSKYKYIRNYMPQIGWDRGQEYLDFYRPAIHVMRMLKSEGKLNRDQLLFMADHKPVEELYDLKRDPDELNNLAENDKHIKKLIEMRGYLRDWQTKNDDKGLKDMYERTPEAALGLRKYVMEHYPESWQKILNGDFISTYRAMVKEMISKRVAQQNK